MSFFEVGGYNVGGMNVGGVITAEQRQRMSAGKARKKEAMIQLARQYPEASLAQLEAAYRENYHQTVPRLILTPQQKLANLERRLNDPNYQPVRRERKRPMSQYQANKEILKGKLFGHPQSAKRGATPNFRQKMSENDLATLLGMLENQGYGFWDTLKGVASDAWSVAKEVAPVVLPLL